MQKKVVELVDDIDGSPAMSIRFGLDSVEYSIDLAVGTPRSFVATWRSG